MPNPPFWTRHLRREIQLVLDLGVLIAAFVLAYLLRFDFQVPADYQQRALVQLPFVVLLQLLILFFTGVYQFVWRYVGMAEVRTFLRGALYSATPLMLLRLGLSSDHPQWRIPLSIILMDTIFAFGGLLALRVLRRSLYERYERQRRENSRGLDQPTRLAPVLLAGAGQAGVIAAKELQARGDSNVLPVGFVDDDPTKQGTVIQGIKILGTTEDIPRLVEELAIDQVIITIAATDAGSIRRIVAHCERSGVRVRIIPGLYEILIGDVSISRIRDLRIEDLLGREPIRLDENDLRAFLSGKSVLVTGAGGSIGSELCRQIARYSPRQLLLVERSEAALFEVDRELRELWPMLQIEPLVADVGDTPRMGQILAGYRPEVLIHAAAHKHVPMMERHPAEAVKNNSLAVERLGRLAGDAEVEAFVLISTDKAVRPTSVMGASKRLAELICQKLDADFPKTRFLAVRFGNVMGSTGSVVPIFQQQIERGGPVTVTHPEVVRYFMTVGEAAQLVLQAGAIGSGGEILILDMGEPMKVLDLARDMISLSGREAEIVFTGLRPGEKLFEELELQGEQCDQTRHPKIFVGRLQPAAAGELESLLGRLSELALEGSDGLIRITLSDFLPEANLDRRSEQREPTAAASTRHRP
jgi:FlaA1/EpsC-like NDP-sugar epimerase